MSEIQTSPNFRQLENQRTKRTRLDHFFKENIFQIKNGPASPDFGVWVTKEASGFQSFPDFGVSL